MKIPLLLCAVLAAAPASAQTPSSAPTRLEGQPSPTSGSVLRSSDGRWRWTEGADFVFAREENGRERRIRLPATTTPGARYRVLFAAGARHFGMLEETDRDFGLHVGTRKGAKKAKALLLSSTLRLLDERGRVLWTRPLPEKAIVGAATQARVLAFARTGTAAILLQDVDPYDKVRPLLLVFDAEGRERLMLDYAQWTRIDEFALATDGRALAVRGFGLVPEEGDWSKALGIYPLQGKGKEVLVAAPKAAESLELRGFDKDLWACCVKEEGKLTALGPAGERAVLDADEIARRFGSRAP